MNLKKYFLIILVILPFALMAQKSKSKINSQIAYVEQNIILSNLKGYGVYTKEIDSLKQVFAKEIQESTAQLNEKMNTLLKNYQLNQNESIEQIKSKLKENDLSKFELYLKENELIEKSKINYELMLKATYDQKVQPLLNRVNQTIENYATSHGFLIVLTLENMSPAIAYINKGINITNEINALLK